MDYKTTNWENLYGEGWNNEIVPEAFSHPAKYARGLIRAIYDHMIGEGWLSPGNMVGDAFGGVALGALDAMFNGLHWVGVELEPKFHGLGNANIELWNNTYISHFARWGTAVLLNGDSRNFSQLVSGALDGVVSSPPFMDAQTGGLVSGDKYPQIGGKYFGYRKEHHGCSTGQLGSMREGNLTAVISSPPFGEGETRNRSDFQEGEIASNMTRAYTQDKQGSTNGNLAHLKANNGDLDSVISSPPYMDAVKSGEGPGARYDNVHHSQENARKLSSQAEYGRTAGNLGNDGDETFWQASAQIVAEIHKSLKPGGMAAFVCKDFVRNKQRVPFSDQWRQLCEAQGFVTVEWVRAWVVEQVELISPLFSELFEEDAYRLDGRQPKSALKERKSFFRRLAEKNGSPRIDWEDVIFMKKE